VKKKEALAHASLILLFFFDESGAVLGPNLGTLKFLDKHSTTPALFALTTFFLSVDFS
jgi:hypothetical protein